MDTALSDIADELTNSIAADGQTQPSDDLPMNGKRHTNVGAATAMTHYARVQELVDQDHIYYVDSGSADAYVITPNPAISAYEEGQKFVVRVTNANTGASTLNVNNVGATAIQTPDGGALSAGALAAGGIYEFCFDASTTPDRFVMVSPPSVIPDGMLSDNVVLLDGTFPNVDGQVTATDEELNILDGVTASTAELNTLDGITASTAELNILDGITASTAELNILDGVTLTASNINDAALKSAANTFTGALTFSGTVAANGAITLGANITPDADSSRSLGTTATRFSDVFTDELNDIAVTDFARLSQANTFTAAQTITGKSLTIADTSTDNPFLQLNTSAGAQKALLQITNTIFDFFAASGYSMRFRTNGTTALSIDTSQQSTFAGKVTVSAGGVAVTGNSTIAGTLGSLTGITSSGTASFATLNASGNAAITGTLGVTGATTLTGAVKAATIANSSSETLVAGQLHFIDGNATLPNLAAGQWIEVINDSDSAITISKNGSDTTYWTTTGAAVTTSFTLAARGRLSAVCSPSGSAVYVSGNITGAT